MPKNLFVDPQETLAAGKISFNDIPVNVYNKTIEEERGRFSDDDLVRIYRDIAVLREFESMLNQIKTQGLYNGIETTYPGPAHLSIGQEAAAVGQAYLLDQNDFSFGSHRSHSEILAKALSCIHKLSEQDLMTIMEGFLGGSALRGTDPVVFFESQRIYDVGEQFHEGGVPEERYEIEFGDVNKVRDGKDVTILTIGAALYRAVDAAKTLSEKYGMEADIINLHSLVPLDYTKIIESVKKTGRVVLVSDACARGSFMNDVAKNITEYCFDYLDAPPVVVGARNWITPPFEFDEFFFPQASWILDAINEKLVPLAGYVSENGCTETEFLRRSKEGV